MNAARTPSSLLVAVGLALVGGATGSLVGPIGVVIIALVGLLWALLLTLAVGWLDRPERRRWAAAIIFALFVPIGLLAGSLPDDGGLGIVAVVAIVAFGAVLAGTAASLGRTREARDAWTSATLAVSVFVAGLLSGSALGAQLLFSAALADAPTVFTALIQGYLGDAQALPYYMLNTPLEWLLIPLLVLLTWPMPRLRPFAVAALVIFVLDRAWTYLWFVPQITAWETAPSLSPAQLDEARVWTGLSWVRFAVDLVVTTLLLIAAFRHRAQERERVELTAPASRRSRGSRRP
jgi:energy-converting hydrogenase Eha subunit A